jgi:hypothetical protein
MSRRRDSKLKSWPLAVGALAGAVLAAYGLINADRSSAAEIPDNAVAVVNGRPIMRADYERALAALVTDSRPGRGRQATERRVLDRLIEEELLVQRGVELELMERDRRVRADLSAAVIDLLVARGEQQAEPSDTELRAFYAANLHRFSSQPLQRVDHRYVHDDGSGTAGAAEQRARQVQERWAKAEPVADLVDPPPVPVPVGWLPVAKLRDYVGAPAARASVDLAVGEVSPPLRTGSGFWLLRVTERRAGRTPPFEQMRQQVQAAYRRDAGDQRLRRFLDERRAASKVAILEALK